MAHVADPEFAELLRVVERGTLSGPVIHPAYTPLTKDGFRLQCFIALQFTHWLIKSLSKWHPNGSYAHESAFWLNTYQLAVDAGVVEIREDKKREGRLQIDFGRLLAGPFSGRPSL